MLGDVFTMLAETSGNSDPNSTEAKRILDLQLLFLATFSAGEKLDAKGEEVAKAVVTSFVKATDMTFRCDLLGLLRCSAGGCKSSGALKLLTTMLTGMALLSSPRLPSPTGLCSRISAWKRPSAWAR